MPKGDRFSLEGQKHKPLRSQAGLNICIAASGLPGPNEGPDADWDIAALALAHVLTQRQLFVLAPAFETPTDLAVRRRLILQQGSHANYDQLCFPGAGNCICSARKDFHRHRCVLPWFRKEPVAPLKHRAGSTIPCRLVDFRLAPPAPERAGG